MLLLKKLFAAPKAVSRALTDAINNELERKRLPGVRFGADVMVRGADRVRCGKDVFFDHRSFINCNFRDGFIEMGDNVEIGPYSILWGGGGITIGSDVHLGAHVHITSMEGEQVPAESFDPHKPLEILRQPVKIGSHTLICSNSVICPGVTIGHHVQVAAGAVVVSDVPDYALVAGVPARVIRYNNAPQAVGA
ncbi:MAG TPA: acyltransferase [Candidatus Baltobacteraceae bacterium]|nr:acyltransferase [Candidatus Baltobacteraceae bacterium]